MGKNSRRKKSNRKNIKRNKQLKPVTIAVRKSNFVSEAGPGCFITRRSDGNDRDKSPDWMIGWEDVDPEDFGIEDDTESASVGVPDIALDPEDCTLTICNLETYFRVAYVTVFDTTVLGAHGDELTQGTTTDNDGKSMSCITFIVLCPPCVFAHLCYLVIPDGNDLSDVRIESDVSKWQRHPKPSDEHPFRIGFPLQCNGTTPGTPPKSFLCTQGEDGELTHFFSGNLHAIDFRCPVGTELLAVADGVIVEAKDKNTLTGISVTNLFEWNSILLQIQNFEEDGGDQINNVGGDGPLFVEFVHISKSRVKAGDRVKRGQVIGYSGSVGFSPEPHLHFSAFRSSDAEAPTVRVLFESCNNGKGEGINNQEINSASSTFLPRAGERYDANGIVESLAEL
uniref:M23ase beta-sheet core domain-containing protein n=1 Tax=Pseudo-nitzschia australis TaxID=44445 RepID=A0A7S4AD00_9STRA|mmetsp:Transcript_4888/g.10798  ORF Transcript_4888/g.10798 Transcript_4888/m.10798 type:complete len:396 (+) Transcript_4888:244-1431(+)